MQLELERLGAGKEGASSNSLLDSVSWSLSHCMEGLHYKLTLTPCLTRTDLRSIQYGLTCSFLINSSGT